MVKIARDGKNLLEVERIDDVYTEIAIGKIRLTDVFWEPGMDDWKEIRSLPDAEAYEPEAPPIPKPKPIQKPKEADHQSELISYAPQTKAPYQCSRGIYIGLAVLLGGLGVHNFYANRTNIAVIQCIVTVVTCWTFIVPIFVWIIAIFEAIDVKKDGYGNPML